MIQICTAPCSLYISKKRMYFCYKKWPQVSQIRPEVVPGQPNNTRSGSQSAKSYQKWPPLSQIRPRCLYCKFGNFRENFIFANSVIRHICQYKNSRLVPDSPPSVNDRVFSPFCQSFIISRKKPSRIFPNLLFFEKMIPEFSYNKNDLIKNNSYKCTAVSFKLFKDPTQIT